MSLCEFVDNINIKEKDVKIIVSLDTYTNQHTFCQTAM